MAMNELDKKLKNKYLSKKAFNFKDIIFLSIVIVVSIILFINFIPSVDGQYLEIYAENNLIGKYSLNKDQIITINIKGHLIIVIENHTARITVNDCPNQICVSTPAISKTGESILCAPKKVLLLIVDENSSNLFISG